MASPQDNAKWEAKQREAGWVRGPRITADAAERLRELAFEYRLTPAQVVSRLLIGVPLAFDEPVPLSYQERVDWQSLAARSDATAGFSEQERRDWEAMGG
jgi:hypothetical protein